MTNQTLFLLNWQKGFFDVTLLLCARPSWQNVSLCWKMMLKFWSICVWCVCTVYSSPTTLKFFSRTKSNMSREIYVSFYVFNGRYLHVTSHHIYCLLPISGPVPEPFLTCNKGRRRLSRCFVKDQVESFISMFCIACSQRNLSRCCVNTDFAAVYLLRSEKNSALILF